MKRKKIFLSNEMILIKTIGILGKLSDVVDKLSKRVDLMEFDIAQLKKKLK